MEPFPSSWIIPDWPAPANVKAFITTRIGGLSTGDYAEFNLANHVGDNAAHVAGNRAFLRNFLPSEPKWLNQIHGNSVVIADDIDHPVTADAAFTRASSVVCVVMTADCLPILFSDRRGQCIAVAHAGWRGLRDGVIENTVKKMSVPSSELLAYLGPAIGPSIYLVENDLRDTFLAIDENSRIAFTSHPCGKWHANLYELARLQLLKIGVNNITGGDFCTFRDPTRFYSYRRDHTTGREATMIWRCDGRELN